MHKEKESDISLVEYKNKSPEELEITQIINDLGLERAEKDTMISALDNSIISYFEGCDTLNDIKSSRSYIDNQEALFLLHMNDFGFDMLEKNYFLMQIHNKILERSKHEESPKNIINYKDYNDLKHFLKTDFIMEFNDQISSLIDSAADSDKTNNIENLRKKIGRSLSTAPVLYGRYFSVLKNINNDYLGQKAYEKRFTTIDGVIEGMRHELAFKELIFELEDGTVEIEEVDREHDSRGTDYILKVKVSKNMPEGKYIYASNSEIESNKFIEMELPIDIKSSSFAAGEALSELYRQTNYGENEIDHWVMWSHIYPQDFRLSIDDGKADLSYTKDEAKIYLQYNEQIFAMRDLSDIRYIGGGEEFIPYSMNQRLSSIKKEILKGLNTIYKNKVAA